jgi:cobyrinic acid a,c-diamide synthase
MIAAGGSGAGKTTLTCALLAALMRRGLKPAAFKCGPDYITPMFHRETLGTPSSNLDLFMMDADTTLLLLAENGETSDIAILEGAMGFYDGLGGRTADASAWHLSSLTSTPVLLVEDCRGHSLTLAARIKGIVCFRRNRIRAVLLNNADEGLFTALKPVIEREAGVKVAGFLPRVHECAIESRHLGLVTAAEIEGLRGRIEALAARLEKTADIDALLSIAASAPPLRTPKAAKRAVPRSRPKVRIALARDRAFCFYYEDFLRFLTQLGAELVEFSPLKDAALPPDISGLYIGGGYPELYAAELSANGAMLASVRGGVLGGLPTIAECGGFMYLHRELEWTDGARYPLAGVIDAVCERTPSVTPSSQPVR